MVTKEGTKVMDHTGEAIKRLKKKSGKGKKDKEDKEEEQESPAEKEAEANGE